MASARPAGGRERTSVIPRFFKVVNSPRNDLALTNKAYCSPNNAQNFLPPAGSGMLRVTNGVSVILTVEPHTGITDGSLALNAKQRETIRVSTNDDVQVEQYFPAKDSDLVMLEVEIEFYRNSIRGNQVMQLDANVLSQKLISQYDKQMMTVGQKVQFEFQGTNYIFNVMSTILRDQNASVSLGQICSNTSFLFATNNSGIKIINQKGGGGKNIFRAKDMNFQKLGIGGLDNEFEDIFRRAFATRLLSPDIINKLGIQHVKGMLLWGPPGTGKTLIARQIGKALNGREPKIVNGPEVLSKFVGETEKNVRDLFADAENDQRSQGDASELHIIIFDEIDAICKTRGSTRDGTGVHDSIVNQLLTKIDGVEALNNILLIGMTNRKDMLDEALLRPGRLEVQIEIGLPDERGRVQILQIHSSKMRENSFLSSDVRLEELAVRTKNFSGAELEGLVKSAVSFALNRQVDYENLEKRLDEDDIKVTMADFVRALGEVQPAFGAAIATLDRCRVNGMLDCGPRNARVRNTASALVEQLKTSENTPLLSCLLDGPSGSGKTAIAATVAMESDVPFIKIISAENMVGLLESTKCGMINKVFEDAYKSPLSIIIIDDIERILEFVNIGPRFSNLVLQTLLVLTKRIPPEGRKLLIIGTTSMRSVMDSMDVLSAFNVSIDVPLLDPTDMLEFLKGLEVFTPGDEKKAVEFLDKEMPIKKLLLLLEMSRQGGRGQGGATVDFSKGKIDLSRFEECYNDLS